MPLTRTRLYVNDVLRAGHSVTLDPERAHYLGRVLRLKAGDRIAAFDGSGAEFLASVVAFSRNAAELGIEERIDRNVESPLDIRLLQGVSRGERMDMVVQKATELGVSAIAPVVTARSVVRLSPERADKRRDHWQRIAASACEQCGRNRLPAIEAPVSLDDLLLRPSTRALRLVLAPGSETRLAELERPASAVEVLVGPEGGLSGDETARCRDAGMIPVSMGPRVLRSETAGMAVVAALQSLWGDG